MASEVLEYLKPLGHHDTVVGVRYMALSRIKQAKLRFIMWVARRLGVPMQVHQAFFAKGTSS